MSTPSAFTFHCPSCRKLLGASRTRVGSSVDCPRCRAPISIPNPEGPPLPRRLAVRPSPAPEYDAGQVPTIVMEPSVYGPQVHLAAPSSSDYDSDFPTLRIDENPTDSRLVEPSPSTATAPMARGDGDGGPAARDGLVLPRSVLILWSILAVAASGFAFLAGWLLGRGI